MEPEPILTKSVVSVREYVRWFPRPPDARGALLVALPSCKDRKALLMEKSIEKSAAHAEECIFQAASEESLLRNGLLHARVTASAPSAKERACSGMRAPQRQGAGMRAPLCS